MDELISSFSQKFNISKESVEILVCAVLYKCADTVQPVCCVCDCVLFEPECSKEHCIDCVMSEEHFESEEYTTSDRILSLLPKARILSSDQFYEEVSEEAKSWPDWERAFHQILRSSRMGDSACQKSVKESKK